MKKNVESKTRRRAKGAGIGQEVIGSLKEAIAWASGEPVRVRVTNVKVPKTDVRAVRRKLRLSQSQFAAKFGFQPATLRNWEQRRTQPDGPARVLSSLVTPKQERMRWRRRARG